MPLRIGEIFAEYRILRLLGSGGMGEVYLVQHPRLPRQEALKILRPDISSDPSFRERFNREADLAARLRHPHIVGIHDRGEDDGQLWIAMDYIDGTDASHLLDEKYPVGMPTGLVVHIITAVASALDYAHKKALLHRDVKPANIIVAEVDTDDPGVFLADFGIARPLDETNGITTTNMTVGTVAYAAPEQLMGEHLDERTDQYALAATAYHLLTGVQLFSHSNPAVVISRHLNAPVPALAEVRPELASLDPILREALAKEASGRLPRCTDFARALVEQAAAMPVVADSATPTTPAPASRKPAASVPPAHPSALASEGSGSRGRRKAAVAALAIGVVAIAVGVLWHPWRHTQSTNSSDSTQVSAPSTPSSSSPTVSPPLTDGPAPIATGTIPSAPAASCGVNLDADQVRAAMEAFQKGNPGFAPDGVNQTGGNFDPCATLSTVLVYPYGASSGAPQMALMFHKGEYVSTATPAAYAYMRFNAEQTTDATVVLDFAMSAGSCNACSDKSYESIRFRWQGDHIEMVGVPPSYGRMGP